MTKAQAQMLLPGAGDIQDWVNDQLDSDLHGPYFSMEMAQELLEKLVIWLADDPDAQDENAKTN